MANLSVSNFPPQAIDGPSLLHELIHKHPSNYDVAIEYLSAQGDRTSLTYSSLETLTDRLAEEIRGRLGASSISQEVVPVLIPQTPELYVSWIAVLKAGAAFCPIAPETPSERLAFVLKDVSARVVLCLPGSEEVFREAQSQVDILRVSISELEKYSICSQSNSSHDRAVSHFNEDSLAYVMYTSGSTGQPKGVRIPHRSVSQSLLAHDEHIPIFKRFLQFASPTFDVSVFETFFPLFRGATLVGCERERMLADLPGTIRALSVDAAELTPTVAGTLLRSRDNSPCLRLLLTIGEMLTRQVIREFGGSGERGSILYAMYGPTEASIHCTVAPHLGANSSVSSIGKPLATVSAFIIAEHGDNSHALPKILPPGQSGELAISGQLALGYLNRPEQTAASFIDLGRYGSVYRTGDRARMSADGDLEILGRISSAQVKVRGQRVELGEIENVISRTLGVQQAVVTLTDGVLVAFCVASSEELSVDSVASMCKQWLPRFMRPGDIVIIDGDVPRLSSGKIDRQTLESRYRQKNTSVVVNDNACEETASTLARLWEQEFKTSVRDGVSLWLQGLDSLKAISLASSLRTTHPHITVSSILDCDTFFDLKELLQRGPDSTSTISDEAEHMEGPHDITTEVAERLRADLPANLIDEILPCSPMQISLLAETSIDDALNFNQIQLEICRSIPNSALLDAFRVVAERNQILRSGFIPTEDADMPFAQIVWKDLKLVESADLLHPFAISLSEVASTRLTVSIHHALYDGWSWDLIMADVNSVLKGSQTLKRPQFRVVSQMQRALRRMNEPTVTYWQDTLQGVSPTSFPALRSSCLPWGKKQIETCVLSASEEKFAYASTSLHVSRQSLACAAWMLLLSLYLGSTDITSGIVSSGRTLPIPGIQNIIGPCINTFPFQVDLSRVQTVQDLLFYIHRLQQDLVKFEGTSLHDLKKISGLAGEKTLFDTLFVWQQGPSEEPSEDQFVRTVHTSDCLDYAVVLEIEPKSYGVGAKLTFDTSKLTELHATLLLKQLDYIIAVFTEQQDTRLIDVWQGAETIILSSSGTRCASSIDEEDLTARIEEIAVIHPHRTALEYVREYDSQSGSVHIDHLSYVELLQRANAVAWALRYRWEVTPDRVVCIIAEKSLGLYVLLLGILRAGAAYMCVDPRTPPDRAQQILKQAQCHLVIDEFGDSLLQNYDGCPRCTMHDLAMSSSCSPKLSQPPSKASDLAYAVFTSGSTGTPKGVLITRGNLLSNIRCLSRIYPVSESDKLLQACSTAFDVSVFEIFWTWHMGMTLCTASNDVLFRDLESFIVATGITHLSMTPSVAALVSPKNVPNIKFLVTAGEPMNSRTFENWSGRGLYQGYGPSETTNICNVKPLVEKDDMPNNVGPPLPNTSVFICDKAADDAFTLLPKGAIGEIWIGGEQVGRGYADPALTKKSFIEHPEHGLLYRSGDVGRLLADESLVILGREDDQVKVRGQRIELGDINAALIRSPFVMDAVTLIFKQGTADRIISFWSTFRDLKMENQNGVLFRQLEALLPAYMVPDAIVPVEVLPLTRQGKVDKRALVSYFNSFQTDEAQSYYRGGDVVEDQHYFSEQEASVAEIIARVTGCSLAIIGRNTSFFALAIDSINSIRVARELRESGLGQIDVSAILRHSTIARLMEAVRDNNGTFSDTVNAAQKPSVSFFDQAFVEEVHDRYRALGLSVEAILPCTPLQEAMLSAGEAVNSSAYQNELRFQVNGDIEKLKAAWITAIARHQVLRTGFLLTNSTKFPYSQVVLDRVQIPWTKGKANRSEIQDFDSFQLPPYRLIVHKAERGPAELVLQMHHALYDAEAMALLLADIEAAYQGEPQGQVPGFSSYIQYMASMDNSRAKKFWLKLTSGMRPCCLADSLGPSTMNGQSVKQRTTQLVSSMKLRDLQRAAQESSTTILSWLQAAWARLLSCYLNSSDICFGTVFSGRNLPLEGIDRVIGPCFNTLPVRARLEGRKSNQLLANSLQKTNFDILPFQPTSLRWIQKLQEEASTPLFDNLLLFQNEPPGLNPAVWSLQQETGDMAFPIILEIVPKSSNDTIQLMLHYQVGELHMVETILKNFDSFLTHSVRYPEARANNYTAIEDNLPSIHLKESNAKLSKGKDRSASKLSCDLSDVETQIRKILCELSSTRTEMISKATTIFQLGLDSLNAIQIAARLRKCGFGVTGGDVLEAPSVQELASVCKSKQDENTPPPSFDLDAFDQLHKDRLCRQLRMADYEVKSVRPCTTMQSGILAQFVRSNGSLYFNSQLLRLDHNVNVSKLQEAWSQVVDRHEMLRTGFAQLEDSHYPFVMITYLPATRELPWSMAKQGHTSELTSRGRSCLETLHLPPWRISLTDQDGNLILEISILHALYDAQALDQILVDVANLYHGLHLAEPLPVGRALSSILAQAKDEDADQTFWHSVAIDLQPTKFPDLKVYHTSLQDSAVSSINCTLPLSKMHGSCKELGVTLQVACQTAWAQLLAAYTGQSIVTFGVVVSGRLIETDQQTVFPCINTVPLGIEVIQDIPEMLQKVSGRNAGLIKHQFTPFTSIKKWLAVEDDLFDTIFVLQKYDAARQADPPWTLLEDVAKAEYAVSLEVIPQSTGRVTFRLTYRNDVLPQDQAEIVLSQFNALLGAILLQNHNSLIPEKLLSVVPAEKDWLDAPVQFLHHFVEATARSNPDKVALEFATAIDGNQVTSAKWTYRQLDEEGNRIAQLLISYGALPGGLVGVCFDKCPEASFAILGVLKAGCGYVALDPGAPQARRGFILRDAACEILLTMKAIAPQFPAEGGPKLLVVDDDDLIRDISTDPASLQQQISPEGTCYCLYTSGTTGTPKGCLISHNSAVQAMMSFQRIFNGCWNDSSRWLQFASFHFDVSVLEQYWSWSVGICVTSAPRDLLFEDLPAALKALKITHLDLTPSLAKLLDPQDVPDLCDGVFIVGGEQVGREIYDLWGDVGCLYNFYGPSEVTIGCTVHKRVPKHAKPTNIGQQWDNVGSFVLESNSQQPVLRGAVGELCLSGPLVGKGYLNRKALTAEKFVILEQYKTRVYRTGDLVRLLHDDSFEFLGRIDDQVKLRGQRLEIGEINHVIANAALEIKNVTTLVLKHARQAKERLVSFVSTGTRTTKNVRAMIRTEDANLGLLSQIRESCAYNLPSYMVPTFILEISFIPLTVNNKVDVKALKALFEEISVEQLQKLSLSTLGKGDLPMQANEDNDKIIRVVSSFLQISTTSINPASRLFELGLDSISVIALSGAMRRAGFLHAHPAIIMITSTMQGLFHALADRKHSETQESLHQDALQRMKEFECTVLEQVADILQVPSSAIECVAPCTPLQEGMILASQNDEHLAYYSTFTFELDKSSSAENEQLRTAWVSAREKMQILRTHFVMTPEGVAQVILKPSAASGTAPAIFFAEEEQTEDTSVMRINDEFGRNPCWRVRFPKGDENRREMRLSIFHGLYDGASLPLVLEAVASEVKGNKFSYGFPYQDALAFGPLCKQPNAESFWIKNLRDVTLLNLPIQDTNKVQTTSNRQDFVYGQAGALESLQQHLGVTMSSLFQAAWLLTLEQHFGVLPTLGIVVSGRSISLPGDAMKVVGPMFNTLPWSVGGFSEGASWVDLVKECARFSETTVYQHDSLRDIARWTHHTSPLFNCLFVFQRSGTDDEIMSIPGLWKLKSSTASSVCPLAVEVRQNPSTSGKEVSEPTDWHSTSRDDSITVSIVSEARFLDGEEVGQLSRLLQTVLNDLVSDADTRRLSDGFRTTQQSEMKAASEEVLEDQDRDVFVWTNAANTIRTQIVVMSGPDAETRNITESSNIFRLGLDSIDAIRLSAALRSKGVILTVRDIMHYPTIRQMTEHVGSASSTDPPKFDLAQRQHQLNAILLEEGHDLGEVEAVFPATPMQEGIISSFDRYYNFMRLRIHPTTDLRRLSDAFQQVFDSYPIFRTHFVELSDPSIASSYAQLVTRSRKVKWESKMGKKIFHSTDLKALVESKLQVARAEGLHFPMVDLTFIPTADGTKFVLLGMSHALYDAWSLNLFHRAIAMAYDNQQLLPPVGWKQHLEVTLSTTEEAESFWGEYLTAPRPSLVPRTRESATPLTVHKQSTVSMERMRKCLESTGTTLHALGLACWTLMLAQHLGQLDVSFGVVVSGRTTEHAERLMFPTFNTVVFRLNLGGRGEMTASDLLRHVHDLSIEISQYQHFPLRRALQLSGRASDLFNTLFVYQKISPASLGEQQMPQELPKLYDIGNLETDENLLNPAYPINVEMEVVGDQLQWTVVCQGQVMNLEQVKELVDNVDGVLRFLVAACGTEEKILAVTGPDEEAVPCRVEICGLPSTTLRRSSSSTREEISHQTPLLEAESNSEHNDEVWSPMEAAIRDVLAAVAMTGNTDVGVKINRRTNLFHLGIDSIGAIKVAGSLKRKGIILPVSKMMRALTIERMAACARSEQLSTRHLKDNKEQRVHQPFEAELTQRAITFGKYQLGNRPLQVYDVEDVLPATSGQAYMLGMWEASGRKLFYPDFQWEIRGVGKDEICRTWTYLQNRMPILRTKFMVAGSQVLQVVLKDVSAAELPIVFRVTSVGKQTSIVQLKIHHALYDAVSLAIIVAELRGKPTSALGTCLREYVQLTQGDSNAVDRRHDFWMEYLEIKESQQFNGRSVDTTEQRLYSTGFQRRRNECYEDDFLSDVFKLRKVAATEGFSVPIIFIAAVAKVYSDVLKGNISANRAEAQESTGPPQQLNPDYVVIGIYLANRSLQLESTLKGEVDSTSQLAAPTFNIVPLRVRISESGSASGLLQIAAEVRDDLEKIGRAEHCGVSLQEIHNWTDGRMTIDCVVNFLMDWRASQQGSDMDLSDLQSGNLENSRQYSRSASQPAMKTERSTSEHADGPSPFLESEENIGGIDSRWCAPTVDVEAKIDGGKLSAGVFKYVEDEDGRGGDGEAQMWLKTLKKYLREVVE